MEEESVREALPFGTMDIDMKEEEENKQKENSPRLAFLYNATYKFVDTVFVPKPSDSQNPPRFQFRNQMKPNHDSVIAILNSSNGVLLFYCSFYLKKSPSLYFLQHPHTKEPVGHASIPTTISLPSPNRFLVHGFFFDPHSPRLSFTILEICDTSSPCPGSVLVNRYSSLDTPRRWRPQMVHRGDEFVPLLGENFVFSGYSTYLHGALHWLLEPSGVIAYYLDADAFKFSLINIPGDMSHVNEFGLCNCITSTYMKGNPTTSRSTTRSACNCRYLGECRDKLVYARITGDSEFSVWILEDYYAAVWSNCLRVRVDNVESSLYGGRVLAFSRTNAHIVFLRVKNRIISFNYMTGKVNRVGPMHKFYSSCEDRWDGFVVPLEVPSVAGVIRIENLIQNGTRFVDVRSFKSNAKSGNVQLNRCYHHYAITSLAMKVMNNDQQEYDFNHMDGGHPYRSSIFIYGSDTQPNGNTISFPQISLIT